MKPSTQLQLVSFTTAISAIVLATIPFLIEVSVVALLVMMPTALISILLIGALGEQWVLSQKSAKTSPSVIRAVAPLRPIKRSALEMATTCQWLGCKCAA